MLLSAISICSLALTKIGANSISSFEEPSTEAQVAALLYPLIRDTLLASHPWNFAIVQTPCPKIVDKPVAGFDSRFELPSDCLRVLSAHTDSAGHSIEYKLRSDGVFSNTESLSLTYISRVSEHKFSPFFTTALVSKLAAEFCIPLIDSITRWKWLDSAAQEDLRRAKVFDAQEDSPQRFELFPLIESRN
jgi:hypothetical protein